ncbi:DNA primase family protein [Jeotgalibaca porci]|uniref:DNA primase family protein n=1 Tax=Jeotgalibaca porci TaxID=1868793 RepID=UPI003F8F5C04
MVKNIVDLYAKHQQEEQTNVEPREEFLPTEVCAKQLILENDFALIGSDSNAPLCVYDTEKGIYTEDTLEIQKLIFEKENRYKKANVEDVMFKIKMMVNRHEPTIDRYLIPVNNGVFNLKTKELLSFSPTYYFTSKITTNYIENAPKPEWDFDNWLDEIACGDQEVTELLWQLVNEAVNGSYSRGEYFILVGDGNNAKGSFQMLLINLIGKENVSTLKIHEFGDRFRSYQLQGKVANIGDDIDSEYIRDNGFLQSLITMDLVTLEQKNKDAFSVQMGIGVIFSANKIPKMSNKTNGTYRRQTIIPFKAHFEGKEDKSIKEEKLKDKTVLEYVLHKALQLDFEKFIVPRVVKEAKEEFKKENDPVLEFYTEVIRPYLDSENELFDNGLNRIPSNYAYKLYCHFAKQNGYKIPGHNKFTTDFKSHICKELSKGAVTIKTGFQNTKFYTETYSDFEAGNSYQGIDFNKKHSCFMLD